MGALERVSALLVTGWLRCPFCQERADLRLTDGAVERVAPLTTPRPDVPGGRGFAVRWQADATHRPEQVQLWCAAHPASQVRRTPEPAEWLGATMGQIEEADLEGVRGWVADLRASGKVPAVTLLLDGVHLPVVTGARRLDADAYVGGAPALSFEVSVGETASLGDPVSLVDDTDAVISTTYLGPFTRPVRRLEWTERSVLTSLGQVPAVLADLLLSSPEARALAAKLMSAGHPAEAAVAYAALDAAPTDPRPSDLLPRQLRAELDAGPGPTLLERMHLTATGVDDVAAWEGSRSAGRRRTTAARPGSVAVAGLVGHASGVGLNAELSLEVLAGMGDDLLTLGFTPGTRRHETVPWLPEQVLLHWPADLLPALFREAGYLWDAQVVHGLAVWELEHLPAAHRAGLALLDRAWAPSHFVADVISSHVDLPVVLVPHAVDVRPTAGTERTALSLCEDDFVVHYAFDAHSSVARKNPVGAVRAFRTAFDDPKAVLLVKVRRAAHLAWRARAGCPDSRAFLVEAAADPRIRILTDELDRARTLDLVRLSDCYLSLHRSEGFGYTLAEAMALGVPVVCTAYSGNLDFCDATTSWLVDWSPRSLLPRDYFHWDPAMWWAEPDVRHAAEHLTEVRGNGSVVADRRDAARSRMGQYSVQRMRDRYLEELGRLHPRNSA